MGKRFTAETRSAQSNSHIKALDYEARKPVSVEREHPDRLIIEGVRFSGDFFRSLALPSAEYLYVLRRDDDTVILTLFTISKRRRLSSRR